MNKTIFLISFLLCAFWGNAQEKFTISGYIEDAATGEKLIGANVFAPKQNKGTTSNTFGFFSLTLPKDSVSLSISYIGYQTDYYELDLNSDIAINFKLADGSQLNEVVVTATEQGERIEDKVQMSQIDVPIKQIQKLPALLGEVDILKTLQLLPGVQSGGEGTSGLYVRGGSPDQNLILLDGVPVYNVSHLFGFFSVFNADAIKSVTLTKGGFPARYGGRLSSVLEINMKEGNMKEFKGEGAIGTVFSKLTLEGPIIKDKTSFIVSARRTYIDALAGPFIKAGLASEGIDGDIDVYFYDLNAKINHKFSEKDRLYLSAYLGDDVFQTTFSEDFGEDGGFTTKAGLDWGNITSAMRWNRMWNNKLFSNTTLTYSKYKFNTGFGFEEVSTDNGAIERTAAAFEYISGIEDVAGKVDFDYIPNPNHYIRFGAALTHHTFTPGVTQTNITVGDLDTVLNTGSQNTAAFESGLYIEDDMKIGDKFQANLGVHLSGFGVDGKMYYSAQPRLGMLYHLPKGFSLKGSFATMTQYIHLLTNEGLGLPTDLWVPTTKEVLPEQSWQTGIGIAKTFGNQFEFSIEGYYKEMTNLVSYVEGASFIAVEGETDNDWQDRVTQGDGKSYGAEFFLQKKSGDFTGWIGYTLAWTNRQFDDINGGEVYPFKYDRRHDLSIVLAYDFTDRISASVVWVYGTGNSITLPEYRQNAYFPNGNSDPYSPYWQTQVERAEAKNSYRMDAYHRLDFSVDFHKKRRYWEETIVIGAYNAYSRVNPFFINDETRFGERQFVQYGLFPIVPSLSYRFKF